MESEAVMARRNEEMLEAPLNVLMIVLAAFGTQTRVRPIALGLAVALLLCAGLNNGVQFKVAVEKAQVLAAALRDR